MYTCITFHFLCFLLLYFFFTKFLRVLKHFLYKSTLPLKKTPNKQTPPPKHPPPTHVQFTHNKASSEKSVTSLYYTNLQYAYPQPSEIKSVCLYIELLSVNTA